MPPPLPATDPETEERLKSALWHSLGVHTDHSTLTQNLNATPQFIGALTELVYAHIAQTAKDLETFAKHAGRSQIATDDVMVLARRNEGLEAVLRGFVEEVRRENGKGIGGKAKGKGRK